MNKIAIRKLVLLAVIAVLAAVYAAQVAVSRRSSARTVRLEADPDRIVVVMGTDEDSALEAVSDGGSWLVGLSSSAVRYPADEASVEGMLSALSEIKILGTVSSNAASDADRYGLDESTRITVRAYSGEKLLRTLTVGKNTSTASQCYVQLDGKSAVYLEEKALRGMFSQELSALRSRTVYQINPDTIMAVRSATPDGAVFTVARDISPAQGGGNASVWNLTENTTGTAGPLDDAGVTSWVSGLSYLTASEWGEDGEELVLAGTHSLELITTGGTYTVNVSVPPSEDEMWQCACSSVPYVFTVGKYTAQRYIKPLSDLIVK